MSWETKGHKNEREQNFCPQTRFDQTLRSTSIRGPIELKFGEHIHDSMIFNLNGGDRFLTAGLTGKNYSLPLDFGGGLERGMKGARARSILQIWCSVFWSELERDQGGLERGMRGF